MWSYVIPHVWICFGQSLLFWGLGLSKRHLTVDPRFFPPSSGSGIWMMSRPCLCATPEDGWTLDDCGRCFSFLPQCLQALQTDATPDKRGASSCQQASHQGPRQAVQYLELMHLNKITTVRLPQTHHWTVKHWGRNASRAGVSGHSGSTFSLTTPDFRRQLDKQRPAMGHTGWPTNSEQDIEVKCPCNKTGTSKRQIYL